jgi:hypothetical protein
MVPDPMIMDADDPRRTENKALFDECDHNASSTYQGRVTAAEDARDGRWEGDAVGVGGACLAELRTGPGELVACPVTAGLGLAHAGYAQWRYREQVREAQLNYQTDVDRCFVKYGK